MSNESNSKIGRYRGPAITVGLALSLIAALAIPSYVAHTSEPDLPQVEVVTQEAGAVDQVHVQEGQWVHEGATLAVLKSDELDAQIQSVKEALEKAKIHEKVAVAEEPILGSIGTVRRVVEVPASPSETDAPTLLPPVKTEDPQVSAEIAKLEKESAEKTKALKTIQSDLTSNQDQLEEFNGLQSIAQGSVDNALSAQVAVQKEVDRMSRLYDMGAIARRKRDATIAAKDSADSVVVEAEKRLEEVKKSISQVKETISTQQKTIQGIQDRIQEIKSSLADLENRRFVVRPASTPAPTKPKIQKKVIYGSVGVQASTAPVKVNLIDIDDPKNEEQIVALTKELQDLEAKKEQLVVRASHSGRIVKVLKTKGSNLEPGQALFVLQLTQ